MKKIIVALCLILFINNPLVFGDAVTQVIDSSPPAGGTFTTPLANLSHRNLSGYMNVSISGSSWLGTVTLQRSFSGGGWVDVRTWTTNTEKALIDLESGVNYRMGVKENEYSSGTITVRLSTTSGG